MKDFACAVFLSFQEENMGKKTFESIKKELCKLKKDQEVKNCLDWVVSKCLLFGVTLISHLLVDSCKLVMVVSYETMVM